MPDLDGMKFCITIPGDQSQLISIWKSPDVVHRQFASVRFQATDFFIVK